MNWIKNNAFWVGLVAFLAVAAGGIAFTTLTLKRHADVILEAAKAPPVVPAAPPVVPAAPPVVPAAPPVVPLALAPPPTFDPPERKPRVGPASSKDCAGITVAACAAKRKAACEKLSGGKACIASKGHW